MKGRRGGGARGKGLGKGERSGKWEGFGDAEYKWRREVWKRGERRVKKVWALHLIELH